MKRYNLDDVTFLSRIPLRYAQEEDQIDDSHKWFGLPLDLKRLYNGDIQFSDITRLRMISG
jgi:hypothetical protein